MPKQWSEIDPDASWYEAMFHGFDVADYVRRSVNEEARNQSMEMAFVLRSSVEDAEVSRGH